MNYCTKCGKQNLDTAKFCVACGASLNVNTTIPVQISSVTQPDTEYEKIFVKHGKNQKSTWIIIGIIALLGLGISAYFIFFSNPSKNRAIIANVESKTKESPDNFKIKNTKDKLDPNKNIIQKNIPKPLVPIVKASDVLPKWTENEDISGDHPLIRLYIGAIGKKAIKLFINAVDTVNNLISGYSIVGNNTVMFEGPFTWRERNASTNQANNQIDAPEIIYKMTLFEPESINTNGVFQLEIHISDLYGGFATGSWVSYDGKLYREIALDDTIAAQMK